jgi:hypothetical protein
MTKDFQITEHFWLRHFLVSLSRPDLAEKLNPGPQEVQNIHLLCTTILQPARDRFGKMLINSGYRDDELNEAVGGSAISLHKGALAADPRPENPALLQPMFYWIMFELPHAWSQLVWYPRRGVLHVAGPCVGVEPFWKIDNSEGVR